RSGHVARLGALLVAQLGELAEARLEDALQAADAVAVVHRALVERDQVVAAPELALELLSLAARAPDREPLLEDEHPRHERYGDEDQHDGLDHQARVENQRPDVEVLREGHWSARSSSCASCCATSCGMRTGRMVSRCAVATVTSASARHCASRSTRWRNTTLAPPILITSAVTERRSLSRAGRW